MGRPGAGARARVLPRQDRPAAPARCRGSKPLCIRALPCIDTGMFKQPTRFARPSLFEWLVLVLNVALVVVGVMVLPSSPDVGIVTLALSGSCLVVLGGTVVRKLRYRRYRADRVDVVGGVPIRPQRRVVLVIGGWLMLLGIVLVVFGQSYPLLFQLLAGGVAMIGGGLLVGAVLGWWPVGHLQFDPHHLTIAERGWRARIPWGEITAVVEAEFHSNPVLLLAVADANALDIAPAHANARALKAMARCRDLMGCDFVIMSTRYGLDLPVLSDAITRYVNDAAARTELDPQLMVAGGRS